MPHLSALSDAIRRTFWSRPHSGPPDDYGSTGNLPPNVPGWVPVNVDTVDCWPDAFVKRSTSLADVDSLRLARLEHFKAPPSRDYGRHELIVASLRDTACHPEDQPADDRDFVLLRVDRFSDSTEGPSGTAGAPSGSDRPRTDRSKFITLSEYEQTIKDRYDLVRCIEFPTGGQPTVLDLAAVLETVSRAAPDYKLFSTMCLWYAGSVFDVVWKIFEQQARPKKMTANARAGKIGPFPVYKPHECQVDEDEAAKAERMMAQEGVGGAREWNEKKDNIIRRWVQKLPPFGKLLEDSEQRIVELRLALKDNRNAREEREQRLVVEQQRLAAEQQAQQERERRLAAEQAYDTIRAQLADVELKDGDR